MIHRWEADSDSCMIEERLLVLSARRRYLCLIHSTVFAFISLLLELLVYGVDV